jgi:hypothetical protein
VQQSSRVALYKSLIIFSGSIAGVALNARTIGNPPPTEADAHTASRRARLAAWVTLFSISALFVVSPPNAKAIAPDDAMPTRKQKTETRRMFLM